MLDILFIRDNAELVQKKARQKGYDINISEVLNAYDKRNILMRQVEELHLQSNKLSGSIKGKPTEEQIEKGRKIREELRKLDPLLSEAEDHFVFMCKQVPNIIPDDTPEGGEESSREEKKWGEPRQDEIQDHQTWGEQRDLIDFKRGAKVAGNKFYYLKGDLVQLELAVFQYGMHLANKYGFTPMTVPHLVSRRAIDGTGFLAKGDEDQIYHIDHEDLNLIATAEIPITAYHADEILDADQLPILYVGLSPAYRKEAGAYGKFSRGLYRVHQFNKLELYAFCKPEDSESWHQKIVELEEEFCQALEIPYRLVRIAAGDLGLSAYKKFDIEYWSPADKSYRELMSCSNVTDYQARRLRIRYKKDGRTELVHTLNGTLAAFSRIAIALIENHQTVEGKIKVPPALQTFMAGKTEI